MKILINDYENTKEEYVKIFQQFGYESNELIFCYNFEESKSFIDNYLNLGKKHLDLIITNNSVQSGIDILKASELSYHKNLNSDSFSYNNFRISSIPIIQYSDNGGGISKYATEFNANITKNNAGKHDFFVEQVEECIKIWRKAVFEDLQNLGINIIDLVNFGNTDYFKFYYERRISQNAIDYFANKTSILSKEFIRYPVPLKYDWIILNTHDIEIALDKYVKVYKEHQKYDKKYTERTILHNFFNENKLILLRDIYSDLLYEQNLFDIEANTSEECDYILKTEFPDFLKTTFFEVKKEDVTFYTKKNTKRPQLSSKFLSHLEQVWRYKQYVENPINNIELLNKIEYVTSKYDFVLLAGRLEEKQEIKDKFDSDINRMYNGIDVITYEELEEININYLYKFNRLKI
jgi:hypothetical protein